MSCHLPLNVFFDAVSEVVQRLSESGLVPPYEVPPQHQPAQLPDVGVDEPLQQRLHDRTGRVHLRSMVRVSG